VLHKLPEQSMPFSLGIVRGNKKREAGNSHILFYKEAIDRLNLVYSSVCCEKVQSHPDWKDRSRGTHLCTHRDAKPIMQVKPRTNPMLNHQNFKITKLIFLTTCSTLFRSSYVTRKRAKGMLMRRGFEPLPFRTSVLEEP